VSSWSDLPSHPCNFTQFRGALPSTRSVGLLTILAGVSTLSGACTSYPFLGGRGLPSISGLDCFNIIGDSGAFPLPEFSTSYQFWGVLPFIRGLNFLAIPVGSPLFQGCRLPSLSGGSPLYQGLKRFKDSGVFPFSRGVDFLTNLWGFTSFPGEL
jgi:hypothetical protein